MGYLQNLLAEIRTNEPAFRIQILGVNDAIDGAYNYLIESTLPWLQDTASEKVWQTWGVNYRDVRILDPRNRLVGIYNLTDNNLTNAAHRAALKTLLVEAARLVDTDNDRLPDDWETVYFGNLNATGDQDADSDGSSNLNEFCFGSNPTNALSRPNLRINYTLSGGLRRPVMTYRRHSGGAYGYGIEASADLTHWSDAAGLSSIVVAPLFDGTGTATVTAVLDWPIASPTNRVFRLRASGP